MSEVRTYGGWRRRRGLGLLGLGTTGTLILLGAIATLILSVSIDPRIALYAGPPAVLAGALVLLRVGGTPVGHLILRQIRWSHGKARGHTKYQSGVVVAHPRAFRLPGVLATTQLLSADDGFGQHYGVIWDRRTGLFTATLKAVPASTWLAERSDADTWVANWGGWLASLGHLPAVRWVTVTIDTAPESGSTLSDTIDRALSPGAPTAAVRLIEQLVETAPRTAADVNTYVSVTFDPTRSPTAVNDLTSAIGELSRALDGLASALGTCGVTVTGRATATELARIVRCAFDPAARADAVRAEDLTWADAGPIGAEEHMDHYRHDSGVSVSWAWHEAPRQNVPADVLSRLVAPGPFPKRVSVQYRPLPAAEATRVLEDEVNAAAFREHYRRRTGRDETARDAFDQARARQAAAEEATGAGVTLVTLYVTTTVTDPEDLPRAVAATEAAAEGSRIRLRRLWAGQSAGFATTLPCGVCPAELARRSS
ncbi:SCO6880 family protein [Microtetraspora fusca]|uniref:SCO6880 family protein n=1 Tax=Microtetraspora fusca TaxID=1997 RepID=UPI00082C3D11|nr:SCO6880 family protein [Microtetraspora fusca]